MRQIKFTEGCPNHCEYCYADKIEPVMKYMDPKVPADKDIQIMDYNFLANPHVKEILKQLPKKRYDLIQGIDFRRTDQETCTLLKQKGFMKVRWAWDYQLSQQKIHKKIWSMLKKAGYKPEQLMVFMLVNWKIPYEECCMKLDLLKVWNVMVSDCCWDGGYKHAKPVYWTPEEIRAFRKKCWHHNQMIQFKIYPRMPGPELKNKYQTLERYVR